MRTRLFTKLQKDPDAYIESAGNADKAAVHEAIKDGGEDTAIRVCFGFDGKNALPPLRALGYAASALAIQEKYMPQAQVQFVTPVRAMAAANGFDAEACLDQLDIFRASCEAYFHRQLQELPGQSTAGSVFVTDSEAAPAALAGQIEDFLRTAPKLTNGLDSAAKVRGGDMASYVAAHVMMHDTNPVFEPHRAQDQATTPSRIISLGAQSERPFYLARMAFRETAAIEGNVQTGQLFTRHVLPPYLYCREGEPGIFGEDPPHHYGLGIFAKELYMESVEGACEDHAVASVARDLGYAAAAIKRQHELSDISISPLMPLLEGVSNV